MNDSKQPCLLSIIVLAYNEADNVPVTMVDLRDWIRNQPETQDNPNAIEVIFVDDGSDDDTANEARAALNGISFTVVRHEANRGMGAGIKSGTLRARGERVTFMPADGQIPTEAIRTLLDAADSDTDIVFSVYDRRDDGLDRKLLSLGVRTLILLVHGVRMQSDGPYLFRRKLLDPAQLESDTFFLNFEFPIRALSAGLRTKVVTVECRPRYAGSSKTANARKVWGVGRELLALRWRNLRSNH